MLDRTFWHPHAGGMTIEPGMTVSVRTASGAHVTMRALSAPTQGQDFAVVWVCTQDDYEDAIAGDDEVKIPWPLDAVAIPTTA